MVNPANTLPGFVVFGSPPVYPAGSVVSPVILYPPLGGDDDGVRYLRG